MHAMHLVMSTELCFFETTSTYLSELQLFSLYNKLHWVLSLFCVSWLPIGCLAMFEAATESIVCSYDSLDCDRQSGDPGATACWDSLLLLVILLLL